MMKPMEMYKGAFNLYTGLNDYIKDHSLSLERKVFGDRVTREVTGSDLVRYARNTLTGILVGVYTVATLGCATIKKDYVVTANGIPLNAPTKKDDPKKSSWEKNWPYIVFFLVGGKILYETVIKEKKEAPAKPEEPVEEPPPAPPFPQPPG